MPPFSTIAETTWGFPIASALHVLGLAWFGGLVLLPSDLMRAKRWALSFLLLTGLILFLMQPARYTHNVAFWTKMAVLGAIGFVPRRMLWPSLALWFVVICAARAIAYF